MDTPAGMAGARVIRENDILTNSTSQRPSETGRPGRRRLAIRLFFVVWTLLAVLVVVGLRWRAGQENISQSWILGGGAATEATLSQRIADWFKLVDLNFHGVYPWILLAPYVVWVGLRFPLERGCGRFRFAAHVAACALFAWACHALAAQTDTGRQVVVMMTAESTGSPLEKRDAHMTMTITNETRIITNDPPLPLLNLPPGVASSLTAVFQSALPGGQSATGSAWMNSGQSDLRNSFYWSKRVPHLFADLLNVFAYMALAGLAHAVHFYRRSREREARAVALETQLTRARLHALQAQLHPHFLFNALNAISTLLRRDTRAAQEALATFSELLRMALSHANEPEVTVREDLEFLRRFVEIQQTRLGERLQYEEVVAEDLLDCRVPVLLLQPLVENAIRHGIEPSATPGLVRVTLQTQGERLVATVEDNGAGFSGPAGEREAGMGIGLQNLRSRLQTLYGERQQAEFGPRPDGGFRVRVEIPLRHAPAETSLPVSPETGVGKTPAS